MEAAVGSYILSIAASLTKYPPNGHLEYSPLAQLSHMQRILSASR